MRVAVVLNSRVPSHHAHVIQTVRMCDAFSRNGHEVHLYYPDRLQIDPELRDVPIHDFYGTRSEFAHHPLPYADPNSVRRLFGSVGAQSRLSRGLFSLLSVLWLRLRGSADVYYTRGLFIALFLTAVGLPTVLELHHPNQVSGWQERLLRRIGTAPSLRRVVTLTEPGATTLAGMGIPRDAVVVEPDGVELTAYEDAPSKEKARDSLGLPPEEDLVVYTGSLSPGKGVRYLASALADSDLTLLLVGGSDDERADVRRYCRRRNVTNVELVGSVPPSEVVPYQRAADVLALPPRADVDTYSHDPDATSPLKLFEYMAAGRPIVATALPGITTVLSDGDTGLIVPPADETALRSAVEDVLTDPTLAARLGENARREARCYTWERRARRIVEHL